MPNITSREIRLASRPTGVPAASNFSLAETTLEPLQDQQVLVRNRFMSVDPYMRGRMNERLPGDRFRRLRGEGEASAGGMRI